jgi:hypothetical protein
MFEIWGLKNDQYVELQKTFKKKTRKRDTMDIKKVREMAKLNYSLHY